MDEERKKLQGVELTIASKGVKGSILAKDDCWKKLWSYNANTIASKKENSCVCELMMRERAHCQVQWMCYLFLHSYSTYLVLDISSHYIVLPYVSCLFMFVHAYIMCA